MPRPLDTEEIAGLLTHARTYRSKLVVRAVQVRNDTDWTSAQGDVLHAASGDWWVIDGDERWSVAAEVFPQTYERVPEDRYRKIASVAAVLLTESVAVQTLEGIATAEPGDWLVRNPGGECWPVPAAEFARRYEEV